MSGWHAVQAQAAKLMLEARLSADAFPLDYSTTLRVIRDALLAVSPAPMVISEGANTMDNARCAQHILDCHMTTSFILYSMVVLFVLLRAWLLASTVSCLHWRGKKTSGCSWVLLLW